MGWELFAFDTMAQELAERLAADLSHTRARSPIRHATIDQVDGPTRCPTSSEQADCHLHHRAVSLVPGRFRNGVAVVELLALKTLSSTLPVTNHLGGIAISLFGCGAQLQASGHQFVDVAYADIGISTIGFTPAK